MAEMVGNGEERVEDAKEEELMALAEALQKDQELLTPTPPTAEELEAEEVRKKRRRGGCEVCGSPTSKYSCPRCAVRSCCVACVQQHKALASCSGKRRRTEYLPTARMDLSTLHSDMRFISEVSKAVTQVETTDNPATLGLSYLRRTAAARGKKTEEELEEEERREAEKERERGKVSLGFGHSGHPPAVARLVSEASARGVDLRIMPRGMSRRKENSSYFHYGRKVLSWRLTVRLQCLHVGHCLSCDKEGRTLIVEKASDALNLLERLRRLIKDEVEATVESQKALGCLEEYGRMEKDGTLWSNARAAMKKCLVPAHEALYYAVTPSQSLAEFLRHKAIVEYPELVVYPLEEQAKFPTIVDERNSSVIVECDKPEPPAKKKAKTKAEKPRLPPPQL